MKAMPCFKTIDDYIANQSHEAQIILKELRSIIKEAVPEAIEIMNYKVPFFTIVPGGKTDTQIIIVGYAKFVSLYLFPNTLTAFTSKLKDYKLGKGTIQFPLNKSLPKDLFIQMVKFRRDEILNQIK